MATITIRNLDETVKRELKVRAAVNGRSMEAEARAVLCGLVKDTNLDAGSREDQGTAIHRRFAAPGVELEILPRQFSSGSASPHSEASEAPKKGLGTAIHELFAPLGGVELRIPTRRKSHRQPATFEP
jgi:plasmid stability protein